MPDTVLGAGDVDTVLGAGFLLLTVMVSVGKRRIDNEMFEICTRPLKEKIMGIFVGKWME